MKFWRHRKDEELDAEIRSHLDEAIRDRLARGEAPDEARANALREFGNVGLVKEVTREMWGWASLERLWQDLRFGGRMLRRNPGFSLVAILTLALGIGANTAIFSVVNGVLLRPLPFKEPEQLVRIWEANLEKDRAHEMTSLSNLRDWQSRNRSFEGIAAWQRLSSITLTGQSPAVELTASVVTADFFALLGVNAAIGRTFTAEESQPGRTRVAVLSHKLWQQLGANAQIAGATIQFEKTDFQIVGVLPADFNSPAGDADLWLPLRFTPNEIDRGQTYLSALARMRHGVTLAGAQADVDGIAAELAREYPASNRGRGLDLVSLHDQTVGQVRSALRLIFCAVALLLLLACANVANLLLVRATGRRRELAVRAALGASRWQIVRQLVTESLLLFAGGGIGGLFVAAWALELLKILSPGNLPRLGGVSIDGRAFLFTAVVALLTGVAFSLATAFHGSATDLTTALKAGQPNASSGRGETRLRHAFVIAQIALACVLLIGTGLMLKSFLRLSQTPPGFDAHNLLVVRLFLDDDYRQEQRQVAFYRELTQRLKSLPGVKNAGAATVLPMNPFGIDFDVPWYREGEAEPQRTNAAKARFRSATPDYFQAMGIPLLKGRAFTERDEQSAPRVVIVNQSLAERAWPGESALGKRLRFFWADWQSYEVVGVVGNAKSYGLASDWRAELFVPHAQIPYTSMNVVVRTANDPANLVADVRRVILELDATQPPHSLVTMEELVSASVAKEKFALTMLEILAVLALLLAALGIYSVLSYAVSQRTREIGLRLALGAQTNSVLRLIVGKGMRLSLAGIVVGLLASFGLTRLMRNLLFGVTTTDSATFALTTILLLLVALLACWIPARRAMKVDPLIALRHE